MPNNVVYVMYQLVAVSKQAGGITFTDQDGNIITDDDDKEDDNTRQRRTNGNRKAGTCNS